MTAPAAARPRVLLTLADVAHPADAGKRLRAAATVAALAARCDLEVVVLHADADPALRPLPPGVDATWHVVPPTLLAPRRAALDAAAGLIPWQVAVQDWSLPRALVAARGYDLVWYGALDHYWQLRGSARARHSVVDCDDVETDKLAQLLALDGPSMPAWKRLQRRLERPLWGRIQRRAVAEAGAVLVCSDLDRDRLVAQAAKRAPALAAKIINLPNTYPLPAVRPRREPQGPCTLVMVANFGTDQNVDAATFAAREVLPLLRAAVPGAQLRLVGRRPDRLGELTADGLVIAGPVDSVADELAGAHAVLVPIRFGGGTRLKVLEAFAYGTPVVSTTAGAEGLHAVPGRHLLLGDSPAELVAAVCQLLADQSLADRLGSYGRELYEQEYTPAAAGVTVARLLDRLLSG